MRGFFIVFFVLFFWGCASTQTLNPVSPVVSMVSPDAKLFREACNIIVKGKIEMEDYFKAREMFSVLLAEYPDSRWAPYARLFIKVIDGLESSELSKNEALERVGVCQSDLERVRRSLEQTTKEIDRLEKENRRLRDDLETLKRLEIDLQKRGRFN
ncbi:MAG: hypothetical protein N2317_00710 [Syntrophales bacterium]|nr:hypothetical protein [Syntrophales bacterium]